MLAPLSSLCFPSHCCLLRLPHAEQPRAVLYVLLGTGPGPWEGLCRSRCSEASLTQRPQVQAPEGKWPDLSVGAGARLHVHPSRQTAELTGVQPL